MSSGHQSDPTGDAIRRAWANLAASLAGADAFKIFAAAFRIALKVPTCKRGHPRTDGNLYEHDGYGSCRVCITLRGRSRRKRQRSGLAQVKARSTHCRRGHEMTPENIYTSSGGRQCRACAKLRRDAYRMRRWTESTSEDRYHVGGLGA